MATRRKFIGGALAGTFLGTPFGRLLGMTSRAGAQNATQIRISSAAPPSDFLNKALDQLKADVDAAAVGLDVSVHPASTLFKQGTEVPAMQRGNLEMSTMTTFEVAQQIPELGYFNRGYLMRDYAHLRRVFDGPIGEDFRKTVSAKMGINILATHYLGTRQVNLRQKRAVKAPADLAGVKLRMPAGPEWLLLGRTLGVTAVPLGMPEVYLALKTGTMDGQENPLSILNAAKFFEVTEQVVLTSHMIQPVFFAIAQPVWDKLSADQKKALGDAALKSAKSGSDNRLADEAAIVTALKGRGLSVDAVDLTPFRESADRVYGDSDAAKAWDAAGLARVQKA
jgi:tripartite ATP-independent transporter DctP family solute receptor